MLLTEFNAMPAEEAAAVVRPCADVDVWVEAILAGRPFGTVDELIALADENASRWRAADVDAALARHPRIGERATGDGVEDAMSRREQASLGDADAALDAAVADGNRRYEERFDRIFLIRAADRSKAEVLDQLEQRLRNDEDTEAAVVAGQLREIAVLRLRGLFDE